MWRHSNCRKQLPLQVPQTTHSTWPRVGLRPFCPLRHPRRPSLRRRTRRLAPLRNCLASQRRRRWFRTDQLRGALRSFLANPHPPRPHPLHPIRRASRRCLGTWDPWRAPPMFLTQHKTVHERPRRHLLQNPPNRRDPFGPTQYDRKLNLPRASLRAFLEANRISRRPLRRPPSGSRHRVRHRPLSRLLLRRSVARRKPNQANNRQVLSPNRQPTSRRPVHHASVRASSKGAGPIPRARTRRQRPRLSPCGHWICRKVLLTQRLR